MSPANRTLAFMIVAACSVAVAVGAHNMYQPSASQQQKTDVGTTFYPSFEPTTATYLGVAAFNTATNKVDQFVVEKKEGRWRIPSHHNYPADAKDRVARTAASMIDVTRGQLVTESASSHERLKLLDPLDKNVVGAEGRGSRITIKNGDTVLTDLIIGKKEEGGPGTADRYYIRRADEDRVYLAEVRPDLTTKFTDWIQPNVLDATATTFREIDIERYSVEFEGPRGKIIKGDASHLSRNSASDEWKLAELPEGKKLKTSVVTQMVSGLADMKIVGVRPKSPALAAAFRGDRNAKTTSIDEYDMADKGYFNTRDGIKSKEGDFFASTSEGITYELRFGGIVGGEDVDIEIGSSKKLTEEEAQKALEEKAQAASAEKKEGAEAKPEEPQKDGADSKPEGARKENRFLFVTAVLDEKQIGAPPVEPEKPTPPEGYQPKEKPAKSNVPVIPDFNDPQKNKPAGKKEPKKDTSSVERTAPSFAGPGADPVQDEKKADPAAADEKAAAEKPAEKSEKPAAEKSDSSSPQPPADKAEGEKPAVNPAQPAPKDPAAEYEAALAKYEQELAEYKVKKADYDEKVKKAREREKALNARFADWYYVISADVFNSLNVKPDELVESESAAKTDAGLPGNPLGGFKLPGGIPGVTTKPATPPETTDATPPAEPAKETLKADAPKSDETKDEKKPEEGKSTTEQKVGGAQPEKKPE